MKFTSIESAQTYLRSKKYHMSERFSIKGDRAYLYKKRSSPKFLYLQSRVDYLDGHSMDRGVVWIVDTF
jgi:hypothetical protein